MESFIKSSHIFDNINIVSKLYIVKVFPKSDMAIIWIDIWDLQNGLTTKKLVNWCFNVSSYIITIRGANMNLSVLQYKNCWKWGHTIFTCRFQGIRYLKYNSPHKVKHYCHFTWCCKTNFKINSLCLETKQSEPCPYSSKYINCKSDYQANSYTCLFWYHWFNKE